MDQTGFYLCMELNVNAFVQNREYPLLAMYIGTTNSGKSVCFTDDFCLRNRSEIYNSYWCTNSRVPHSACVGVLMN